MYFALIFLFSILLFLSTLQELFYRCNNSPVRQVGLKESDSTMLIFLLWMFYCNLILLYTLQVYRIQQDDDDDDDYDGDDDDDNDYGVVTISQRD